MDSEGLISYKIPYCSNGGSNVQSENKFHVVQLPIEEYNRILFEKPQGSVICPACGGTGKRFGLNDDGKLCDGCGCPMCKGARIVTWIQNVFGFGG